MYTVNKKCSTALKLFQQSVKNTNQQELNIFKYNREQIKQNAYSTKATYKPIKKLMVANRGA
jgi:hypothetical protein